MDPLPVRPAKGRRPKHRDLMNPIEGVKRRVEPEEIDDPCNLTGRIGCEIFKPDQAAATAVDTRQKGQDSADGMAPGEHGLLVRPTEASAPRFDRRRPVTYQD